MPIFLFKEISPEYKKLSMCLSKWVLLQLRLKNLVKIHLNSLFSHCKDFDTVVPLTAHVGLRPVATTCYEN